MSIAAGTHPESLAPGDFDEDGQLDLAVLSHPGLPSEEAVHVFRGRDDGTFRPAGVYPVQAGDSLLSADLNGDGHLDLAVASDGYQHILLWAGKGDGTFVAKPERTTVGLMNNIMAADFDGDGLHDLAGIVYDHTLVVYDGLGNWRFDDARQVAPEMTLHHGTTGDADGDGDVDLVVAADDKVHVFGNDGRGEFAPPRTLRAPVRYLSGPTVGDFDDDGRPDIAAGVGDEVYIWFGRDGSAAEPVRQPLGIEPLYLNMTLTTDLTVADLDGDGRDDLFVTVAGADHVATLLGTGTTVMRRPGPPMYSPYGPVDGAVGDFDADGHPDLVVASYNGKVDVRLRLR